MPEQRNIKQLLMQVSRAREALGNALGLIQDIDSPGLDLSSVSQSLAQAVGALFEAEEQQLQHASPIGKAMQNLRNILEAMQDVQAADAQLQVATSTIARILAILFPVFKALSTPRVAEQPSHVAPQQKNVISQPHSGQPVHDERRNSPRKAISADIGFQSDSNFFTGFSTDISSGGLFVATYDMPPIGTVVNLNFQLPSGPIISVDGEVRWTRELNETTPDIQPGIGVKFSNLSKHDANQINLYMEDVQPLFFDES